ALRRLGTRGDPVGVRRGGLTCGRPWPRARDEGRGAHTSPSHTLEKAAAVHSMAATTSARGGKGPPPSPSWADPGMADPAAEERVERRCHTEGVKSRMAVAPWRPTPP